MIEDYQSPIAGLMPKKLAENVVRKSREEAVGWMKYADCPMGSKSDNLSPCRHSDCCNTDSKVWLGTPDEASEADEVITDSPTSSMKNLRLFAAEKSKSPENISLNHCSTDGSDEDEEAVSGWSTAETLQASEVLRASQRHRQIVEEQKNFSKMSLPGTMAPYDDESEDDESAEEDTSSDDDSDDFYDCEEVTQRTIAGFCEEDEEAAEEEHQQRRRSNPFTICDASHNSWSVTAIDPLGQRPKNIFSFSFSNEAAASQNPNFIDDDSDLIVDESLSSENVSSRSSQNTLRHSVESVEEDLVFSSRGDQRALPFDLNQQRQQIEWEKAQRLADYCAKMQQQQVLREEDQKISLAILLSEAHRHHRRAAAKKGQRGANVVFTSEKSWKNIAEAALEDFSLNGHATVQRMISCMCVFSPVSSAREYSDHEDARIGRQTRQREKLFQLQMQGHRGGSRLFLES